MKPLKLLLVSILLHSVVFAATITIDEIQGQLQSSLYTHLKGQNKDIVQQLYAMTGNKPLWVDPYNKEKMNQLISALKDPLFNYKDLPFDQPSITRLFFMLDNDSLPNVQKAKVYARLDLMLTNSLVRLVRFIVEGDVDWGLVQQKMASLEKSEDTKATWEMQTKSMPGTESLRIAVESPDVYPYLISLLPMEKRYRKLVKLLKDYRVMEKFPKIPYSNKPYKLGDRSGVIEDIKKYLQITGDYPKSAPIDSKFDQILQQAVISYQKRYNLKVNGEVDKVMTYYLNQPVKNNIQSIITNLDKTKLYPKEFEEEHVEVNIPDFNLRYYKDGWMQMKMGVVVGRLDRPTPLFHDFIEYMVLNPTWTITDNLIKRDLIPVLKENPNYLVENDIKAFRGGQEVQVNYSMLASYANSTSPVPYTFVQQPGEKNALGRVKFIFPNKYDVYLHDTDNKSLLDRRYKVYSSGCMRVQKPYDLMMMLLEHTRGGYNQAMVDRIFATNKPTNIALNKHIPVHLVYFTVYEEDGMAYFKNDIYLYDKIIEESILGRSKATFTVPEKRLISVKKNRENQEQKKKN